MLYVWWSLQFATCTRHERSKWEMQESVTILNLNISWHLRLDTENFQTTNCVISCQKLDMGFRFFLVDSEGGGMWDSNYKH